MASALAQVAPTRTNIEQSKTIHEALGHRAVSVAGVKFLKTAKAGTLKVNAAVESKLRSERKAGEFLAGMVKNTGVRVNGLRRSHDVTAETLDSIGITKMESHRWQKIHAIPAETFDSIIEEFNEAEVEITTAGFLRKYSSVDKPCNAKPPTVKRASVVSLLMELDDAVRNQAAKWEPAHLPVLCERLRTLAEEIETNGGLAE